MADRGKVLKGLECCLVFGEDLLYRCDKCPYRATEDERKVIDWRCHLKELRSDALELLKEQEPVEPIPYDFDTPVTTVMRCYKCGCCNAEITAGNPYCWHCGRAVKWDD